MAQPNPSAAIRIGVIGAGVSGLRAASSSPPPDSQLGLPIDLGASWIHGTRGNPLVQLVEEAKATTVACGALTSICDQDGNWLDPASARRYYEEVWEILEKAMEWSRKNCETISSEARMMDFFMEEVRKRAESRGVEEYENLWLDAGLEGDNLFVASTFRPILDNLLSTVSDSVTLLLNSEVVRFESDGLGKVEVQLLNGDRVSFDSVIVTAPLGWLKRNQDAFIPPLPPRISTAISSLGFGNLDKVFIKFPTAFWDPSSPQANGSHDAGADGSPIPSFFPIESLFLCPNYAAESNPGRHVTGLVRGMPHDSEEYCQILDDVFRPYYSRLPGYNPANPGCKPSQFLSTDWQSDKFAGYGSFCNQPVGSGNCEDHQKALREGIGGGHGIWFAGEHASPPGGLGTVAGAYWSGEEVARRVAHHHGGSAEGSLS
ncbi:unnamed protein product [Parascedosporium putredinis]|uniref:Amine oxidase domain-containing protein n=1 Tax=Parascedosporium putredinis TaxID=1442378 RepID=A0A9P1H9T0_9PEZI|nr:unnamed protein product [Parascedosporium putredinis]CAI8000734.1 unnamed protein product [Parascedosporium putredinis]